MSGDSESNTYTQDPLYNMRLANIQERQQNIADSYFSFWQQHQAPLEAAQAQANLSLVGDQTALQKMTLGAQMELLPGETELAKKEMDLSGKEIELGMSDIETELALSGDKRALAQKHLGASSDFIDSANINVEDRVGQATADVAGQFGVARADLERTASPYRSGAATNQLRNQEALAKAGAATGARRTAEIDKTQILGSALQNSLRTLGG